MRMLCQTVLLSFAIAVPAVAQDQIATSSDCTQELIENAEHSFRMRQKGSEMAHRAERQLREVVRLCKDNPGVYQAQEHLRVAQEALADANLSMAIFYLNKSNNRKGGRSGALSRLKGIVERYPQYSKLDQVLSLLGKTNVAEGNLDEAATYYQRIMSEYPASEYFGEASIQLNVIKIHKGLGFIP